MGRTLFQSLRVDSLQRAACCHSVFDTESSKLNWVPPRLTTYRDGFIDSGMTYNVPLLALVWFIKILLVTAAHFVNPALHVSLSAVF